MIFVLAPDLIWDPNETDIEVEMKETSFKIKSKYGETIQYKDIESIDTLANIPKRVERTFGYAYDKTLLGDFKLQDRTSVKLFIKKGFAPYLLIKSKNCVPIYLNFQDTQKTYSLYNKLHIK